MKTDPRITKAARLVPALICLAGRFGYTIAVYEIPPEQTGIAVAINIAVMVIMGICTKPVSNSQIQNSQSSIRNQPQELIEYDSISPYDEGARASELRFVVERDAHLSPSANLGYVKFGMSIPNEELAAVRGLNGKNPTVEVSMDPNQQSMYYKNGVPVYTPKITHLKGNKIIL